MRIEKANHIYAALLVNGWSCRAWALSHGYNPRTVQKCIHWFAPNTGRKPKRKLATQILKDLSATIHFDLLESGDE